MFFPLSKIAWALLQPLNVITVLVFLATVILWRGRVRAAKLLLGFTSFLLIAPLVVPIGEFLMWRLEQRFPAPAVLPAKIDGIILLGGAQRPRLTKQYGQPAMNEAAETMTTFLALARAHPEAKIVFSGGSGDPLRQDVSEVDTVRLFLRQQGYDDCKVIYEGKSRNTWENVAFSRQLVKPVPGETWLAIASAYGMPRVMGVFQRAGWPVLAMPCDYRVVPQFDLLPSLNAAESFGTLSNALHEWLGLAAYYYTGKTAALFPRPG